MAFKVEIVNINENFDNIILVSGLTIERLKIKYNWVLNASVKDCIIGEDDNGLVWFSGEWICGEWIDGTWYSGIFHDGIWNNGKWYSYLIDKAMVISNRFVILDKADTYSEFRSGIWKQGDFYNGTFGYDRIMNDKLEADLTGRTFECAYWFDGRFHSGIFKSSVWYNGVFYAGDMLGSYWLNGKFYSGTFNFHNPGGPPNWYNGIWYGGDFVEGNWNNGSFDQINSSIKSRFGTASESTARTIWNNGFFYNGEFHSGLVFDISGNTAPSINSNITHWLGGNFKSGNWFGGHFHKGDFWNGNWYGGVFNTDTGSTAATSCVWHDGNWYNGLWINGVFYDGHFYDGMWIDGQFISGYMSTNVVENPLLTQTLATSVNLPTVITNSATTILSTSAYGNGRVINNGGATILDRGICWSQNQNPITGNTGTNYYVSDGGSMGNISILLNGLLNGTTYYVRAYARNITGLTYGNQISFTTSTVANDVPQVTTASNGIPTSSDCTLFGVIAYSDSTILNCGFYYSSMNTNPGPTDSVIYGTIPAGPNPPATGSFDALVTLLSPTTTYYFKAFAENSNGIGTGTVLSFTTPIVNPVTIPTVTTNGVDTIADTSAVTYGEVTANGNGTITSMGACWSLSANPTISDPKTVMSYASGQFSTTLTGLLPNTTYHVRAYAVNSAGAGYGADLTFTTTPLRTAPVVLLMSVKAI